MFPPPITSSRWGVRTKRLVVSGVIIFFAFFIWNVRGVLPLLIISTLLSYLLWPLVNMIEHQVLGFLPFRVRTLSVFLTIIIVIAVFTLFLILIVPVFIDQIDQIGDRLPEALESAELEVEKILSRPVTIGGRPILIDGEPIVPLERIREITDSTDETSSTQDFDIFQLVGSFLSSISGLTAPVFSVLGGAVNFLVNTLFMFVIMFYMMRDGDKFTDYFVEIVPQSYQGDMRRLFYELGKVWNAYLRGQLILSLSVGFAVYVVALVLGLPNALILGLLAGLLEFIPNFGPFIAGVPAVIIAVVSESSTIPFLGGIPYAVVVALTWTGIQNLEAIFLVPRVMGGSLNLHPVVVIIAVIAGASIAGALGIILAAPFTASARVFGQYVYGKLFDTDPFPPPVPRRPFPSRIWVVLLRFNPGRMLRSGMSLSRRVRQAKPEESKT